MNQYVVKKVLRSSKKNHSGDEIHDLNGICNTLEEAKKIIKEDKNKYGQKYLYYVRHLLDSGGFKVVHQE